MGEYEELESISLNDDELEISIGEETDITSDQEDLF